MKIRNINKLDLNSYKELGANPLKLNSEAILYLIPDKKKDYKVYKDFFIDEGISFSNKLATINTLHDYSKEINIKEFIMPEELCSVDDKIQGYIMEYIRGTNLSRLLKNSRITLEEKIDYLKQLGNVLNRMKSLRKKEEFKDFYIDDLHEDNIIVDCDGKIHILDMDSCKIGGNLPSPSKYLVNLKRKGVLNNKYKLDNYCSDIIVPNEETDNYCFAIILLNFLYQDNITLNSIEYINNYLDYLNNIGISKELIDIFYNLYTDKPNLDCSEFLDTIDIKSYRADKKVYEYKKGK